MNAATRTIRLSFLAAALLGCAPLAAASPATGALSARITATEAALRARLAVAGQADAAERGLARLAMLRASVHSLRQIQGGAIAGDQQARLAGRLAQIAAEAGLR